MDGLRIQREWTKGDKGVVRRVLGVQGDYVWDGEKVVDLWRENQPVSSGIGWGRRAVFLFTLCAAVCLSLYCWNLIVSTEKHQPFLLKKVSEVTQSCPTLATPWIIAYQVPPSMGFSRQEYWSGVPFPSPGDLSERGIKPRSPNL